MLVALEKLVGQEDLLSWEATIRTKFDADNAHLLMGRPTGDDNVRAVIRPLPPPSTFVTSTLPLPYLLPYYPNTNPNPNPRIRGLGRSLGETKAEVRSLHSEIVQQRMQLQQLLERHLGTAAGPSPSPSPVPDGPPALSAAPPPASPAAATPLAASSPLGSAASPPTGVNTGASPASASGASSFAPLIAHVATGAEPRPDLMELSKPLGRVYANIMARGGAVPSTLSDPDKNRVKLLLQWCNATATADEKLLLLPAKVG